MKIVCISDTHNRANGLYLPEGDVLIHAGDHTGQGTPGEIIAAAKWLGSYRAMGKFKHIVTTAGNHDFGMQDDPVTSRKIFKDYGIDLLLDESLIIDGINFYGSPWQPHFYDWAYNFPIDPEKADIVATQTWAKIPWNTNVLITHGPPRGILDKTYGGYDSRVGCPRLLEAIQQRTSIKLHVFGHIHESNGVMKEDWNGGPIDAKSIMAQRYYINAAICDRAHYDPKQPYHQVELNLTEVGYTE